MTTHLETLLERLRKNSLFQELLKELEDEFIFTVTHQPGDPYQTAFREGQRSIAIILTGREIERDEKWQKRITAEKTRASSKPVKPPKAA